MILGNIHCCGGKRKTKSYAVSLQNNCLMAELDYLEECPVCGHTIVQLTRIDFEHEISVYRQTNEKARKLFANLKKYILFEKKAESSFQKAHSKFYLNYNEYGVKKKCYSNLSTLRMGRFENQNIISDIDRLISSTILTKAETPF